MPVPFSSLPQSSRRRGISLIEIVVVLAVFGILMAILMPALIAARQTAQRTQCTNNLKQLGLALTSYEAEWDYYPNGLTFKYTLLPYLDHEDVYRSHGPEDSEESFYKPIADVAIPTYYCPSDTAPVRVAGARSNYAGCFGSGVLADGLNGIFVIWRPDVSPPVIPIGSNSVMDGLSNTAAIGEFLSGTDDANAVLRVLWNTPRQYSPTESEAFAQFCSSIPQDPVSYGYSGVRGLRGQWYDGNYCHGLYNHVLTPNQPSCLNQTNVRTGISTTTSLHPGGVNLLIADGHVRFVSNSIDQSTWRELGSRVSHSLSH